MRIFFLDLGRHMHPDHWIGKFFRNRGNLFRLCVHGWQGWSALRRIPDHGQVKIRIGWAVMSCWIAAEAGSALLAVKQADSGFVGRLHLLLANFLAVGLQTSFLEVF